MVVTAPSKVKGGSELQLPSMNALTNKTSSQAFFLRVLKVIIQLRETALASIKKAKTAKAAKDAVNAMQQAAAAASTAAATAVTPTTTTVTASSENTAAPTEEQSTPMEVEETAVADAAVTEAAIAAAQAQLEALESLSDELQLAHLWEALSSCLRDLAHTPDHHAVLVLQVNPSFSPVSRAQS